MKRSWSPVLVFFILASALRLWATPNAVQSKSHAWAMATPKSSTLSINTLGRHLGNVSSDEYTRALTIYYWVCNNISYDMDSYLAKSIPSQDAATVLARRTAVCAGYASLYKELCLAAGIQCQQVSGYAKGYSYQPGKTFDATNHAWNAVLIYGKLQLVDACWGRPEKGSTWADPYYFCASPSQFLAHHLPADPALQLVANPMTLDEFEDRPSVKDLFHQQGFESYYPSSGLLPAKLTTFKLRHGLAGDFEFTVEAKVGGVMQTLPTKVTLTGTGVAITVDLSQASGTVNVYASKRSDEYHHVILTYAIQDPSLVMN